MANRMAAVEEAGKEGKRRNAGRFYYIDVDKLERAGIASWIPKEGANFISIIPPVDEDIFYAREVYVHYKVGGEKGSTHLCPKETRDIRTKKKWNKPCAVCDKRKALASKEATRLSAEELKPGRRFFFYLVDTANFPEDATRDEMEKSDNKVSWYDGSPTFRDCITGASANKRKGGWVDVSDPDNGMTICFDRDGKGLNTKYKNFATEAREPIPDKWLEVPDYDDILLIPDYDEVAEEVDLGSYAEEEETTSRRGRGSRERTVDEDSPSESDDTPRRSRSRTTSKDESKDESVEEKIEGSMNASDPDDKSKDKTEEKTKKKTEEKTPKEEASGDTEVDDIKERIRKKRKSREDAE